LSFAWALRARCGSILTALVAGFMPHASWSAPALPSVPTEPVASASGWVRVGVVVASKSGLEGDKPLQYAYTDGERLQTLLRGLGQMRPENLHLIRTESAEVLRSQLEVIGRQMEALHADGSKVMLQFYYTGHGGGNKFHLGGEQVSFGEVKGLLEKGKPQARVYVLDVCQGASFFASKGFNTTQPVRVAIDLDKATKGEVTISSSASEEQAYEVKTLGGSIFTSHWEMALRGAGDRNHDGQVTLFEAYNYAYDQTVAFSRENLNLPQHPSFSIDLTGAKDLQLTRPFSDQGGVLFRNCPTGTYALLDVKRGIPVGEMRIPDDGEFSLALEPGLYRIDHTPTRGPTLSAQAEVSRIALTPILPTHFGLRPRSAAVGKGSEFTPIGDESDRFQRVQAVEVSSWDFNVFAALRGADRGLDKEAFLETSGESPDLQVQGEFVGGKPGMSLGVQTMRPGAFGFRGGFQFIYETFDATFRGTGSDFTLSGVALPVRVERQLHVTPILIGLMAQRSLVNWKSMNMAMDASVNAVHESVRSENVILSPLYGESKTSQEWSGWGYGVETHVIPSFAVRLPSASGDWLRCGMRLGLGYHVFESLENDRETVAMQGTWHWRMGLQLGLSGGHAW
jgi:hypothetical protein